MVRRAVGVGETQACMMEMRMECCVETRRNMPSEM